jgi:hypothetical protein
VVLAGPLGKVGLAGTVVVVGYVATVIAANMSAHVCER